MATDWSKLPPAKIETLVPNSKLTQVRIPDRPHLTAIVEVHEADYVPEGFTVRARLDAHMFTADTTPEAARRAQTDEKIRSFSLEDRLQNPRPIKPKKRKKS